jgi:hypothetical protein
MIVVKLNLFISVLEELRIPEFAFEIIWPLKMFYLSPIFLVIQSLIQWLIWGFSDVLFYNTVWCKQNIWEASYMIRIIHGLRISDRVNMLELQTKIKMMSVNQMTIYHTIMEVFNILYNYSSEQINKKYRHHERHSLRKNTNNFLRVPEISIRRKCTGFT